MNYNKINIITFLKYLAICLSTAYLFTSFFNILGIEGNSAPEDYIIIIYVTLLAPLIEEVIFRKLLLKLFLPLGQYKAIIISAILFGIWHFNVVQFFYTFVVGVVLATIAQKYGTIKYGIVIHMILNLTGMTTVFFNTYVFNAIYITITVLSIIIVKKDYKELFCIESK